MTKKKLTDKLIKIKLILTDVDGVLTDGGRYYSSTGEISKRFHTRDGMGVNLLLRNSIKTAIVTKETSKIVKKWAKDMNISTVYHGIIKKEEKLSSICSDFSVLPDEIAYMGDDVNDIKLLNEIGFSSCPHDAIDLVKEQVDFICKNNGGMGAFRETADLILFSQFPNKQDWY